MIYLLHIWNQPRPATLRQAFDMALRRDGDIVGQEPAFLTLAARLTQRYSCITTLTYENGVWSHGQLDGKTEKRTLMLGITQDHERVVEFIKLTAAELGLCVFDMKEERAYLADGTMLDADRPTEVAPDGNAVDESTIREAVLAGLLRLLGAYGFTRHGSGQTERLHMAIPGGHVEVQVEVIPEGSLYDVFLTLPVRLDHVVEIVLASRLEDRNDEKACHNIDFYEDKQERYPSAHHYEIGTRDQLCAVIVDMCQKMAQIGIPKIAQCMDLRSFDRFLNGGTDLVYCSYGLAYNVTIAKLAGNPDYRGIAHRVLEAKSAGYGLAGVYHMPVEIARLLDYLSTYDLANPPPPLFNPVDDLRGFVRRYDGSMVQYLRCIPSAPSDPNPWDENRVVRDSLLRAVEAIPLADYPDVLVCDMFLAMAQSDRLQLDDLAQLDGAWYLWLMATELMRRTGVDGLAMVVENVALNTVRKKLCYLPPDFAATLAARCHSRAADPCFAQHAAAYSVFGRSFAQRAAKPHWAD